MIVIFHDISMTDLGMLMHIFILIWLHQIPMMVLYGTTYDIIDPL